SVATRLLTRVGINRRRATSEENILYSIHVINEVQGKERQPTTFMGAILLEDENLAESLKNFINYHNKSLRFGSSTSRGLGKVDIESVLTRVPLNVKSRVDRFNKKLKERWNQWQIFNPAREGKFNEGRTYFTINLQSDAILIENWRRTTVITEAMLEQFADVEDSSLKLEVAYSSYDYFWGWNAAWGLQKDTDLIVNKGGVYLFSTEHFNLWEEKLAGLEFKGVGEKTCEGFGQIEICNEFHLVLRGEAV
ncbi:MAG: CRISPR-associated RAMP protein Csx10, partial [Cyanobacteriota bacterium]|nr:CRISPR-associated RAMP protein Csx10 [Cyanobacteriota bacterium]